MKINQTPPDTPLQTTVQDFDVLNKLGEGSFSTVYKVKRKSDGKIYALKKVKFGFLKPKEKENALSEIRILASLNNDNIIGYKEAFYDEKVKCLCIIQEYAENGDLQQLINRQVKKGLYLDQEQLWSYVVQLVQGIKKLHDHHILHRDIKSANVFLTNNETTLKLGDLNVSKVAKAGMLFTQTGTPYYAAPEVWQDQPTTVKSDIWSLGCVIYEMITLLPPFKSKDMQSLYKKVTKGTYPQIPQSFDADLKQLVDMCLQKNPSKRPSSTQLLQFSPIRKRIQREQEKMLSSICSSNRNNNINSNIHNSNLKDKHVSNLSNLTNAQSSRLTNINTNKESLLNTIKMPNSVKQFKKVLPKQNYGPVNRSLEHIFDSKFSNSAMLVANNKNLFADLSHKQVSEQDILAHGNSKVDQGGIKRVPFLPKIIHNSLNEQQQKQYLLNQQKYINYLKQNEIKYNNNVNNQMSNGKSPRVILNLQNQSNISAEQIADQKGDKNDNVIARMRHYSKLMAANAQDGGNVVKQQKLLKKKSSVIKENISPNLNSNGGGEIKMPLITIHSRNIFKV